MPQSSHLDGIAAHIAHHMDTPDLLFLQEVQDNYGTASQGGVVAANETLQALADAVKALSGVAYLYNPAVFSLAAAPGSRSGNASEPVAVRPSPALSLNPGRIDSLNPAFAGSRKPLAAAFVARGAAAPLFAVNVHSTSKGGSTLLHGGARPPVNGGVADRLAQHRAVADFARRLLREDRHAKLMVAGDFNEFPGVAPMAVLLAADEGEGQPLLYSADAAAGIPPAERYSYRFDMNAQQLDHTLLSAALRRRLRAYEHIHVNTWAAVDVSDQYVSVPPCLPLPLPLPLSPFWLGEDGSRD